MNTALGKSLTSALLFASGLLASDVVSAAAIGTPLIAEIPVSSSIGIGPSGAVSVAIDAVDNFSVAWLADIQYGGGIDSRLFTAAGAPITPAFAATLGERANDRFAITAPVAVSRSSNGRTAIAWSSRSNTNNPQFGDTIFASIFAADGSPILARIPVSSTANDGSSSRIYSPSIAFVSANEFVVAWVAEKRTETFNFYININSSTIYARRFDLNGTPLGDDYVVHRIVAPLPSGFIDPALRIIVNPAGGHAIAHGQRGNLAGGRKDESLSNSLVHFRSYGADGRASSLDRTLPLGGDGSALVSLNEFGLSYLANGDLALAYAVPDQLRGSTTDTLFTRRYSPTGTPRDKPVPVATRGKRVFASLISLNLAPIPSGGYVVAWPDNAQNLSFAQYYAADGSAIGPTFPIGMGASVNAVTTADGSLLASYGGSLTTSYFGVFARLFAGP